MTANDAMGERLNLVPPDGNPYEQLSEIGVTYDSSMAEIHRKCQAAQRQLTPTGHKAWAELRDAEKRLLLDLLHFQPDPAAFGEASAAPTAWPEPTPPPVEVAPPPDPSLSQLAAALGPLPTDPMPSLPEPGEPPPLEIDLWELLRECWQDDVAPLDDLPPPGSFLEDE